MGDKNMSCLESLEHIRSLHGFLKTETSVEGSVLTIKIQNVAPPSNYGGEVVFTNVGINITSKTKKSKGLHPHQSHQISKTSNQSELRNKYREDRWIGGHGDSPQAKRTSIETSHGLVLFPGESVIIEPKISEADLPYLDIRVEALLSRRHLFLVSESIVALERRSVPLIKDALKSLKSLDFFRRLCALKDVMPAFGAQTTVTEIGAYRVSLEEARDYIKQNMQQLRKLQDSVPERSISDHIEKDMGKFLSFATKVCNSNLEAISTSDITKMKEAAEEVYTMLARLEEIKEAQEKFLSKYGD